MGRNPAAKTMLFATDFKEALERFGITDPKEVKQLMEREKRKKKAEKAKDPPGKSVDRKDDGG